VKRFRLAPEARGDIRDIWSYIAAHSVEAAARVREEIRDACRRLAQHPHIGHQRDDLTTVEISGSGRYTPTSSFTDPLPDRLKSFEYFTASAT